MAKIYSHGYRYQSILNFSSFLREFFFYNDLKFDYEYTVFLNIKIKNQVFTHYMNLSLIKIGLKLPNLMKPL